MKDTLEGLSILQRQHEDTKKNFECCKLEKISIEKSLTEKSAEMIELKEGIE